MTTILGNTGLPLYWDTPIDIVVFSQDVLEVHFEQTIV